MARPRFDLNDPNLRHYTSTPASRLAAGRRYDASRRQDPARKEQQRLSRLARRSRAKALKVLGVEREAYIAELREHAFRRAEAEGGRLIHEGGGPRHWMCEQNIVEQLQGDMPCPGCDARALAWKDGRHPVCVNCHEPPRCPCHMEPWPVSETPAAESETS